MTSNCAVDNIFTFAVVNAYILFDGKLLTCTVKNADNWTDDILYIFNVVNLLIWSIDNNCICAVVRLSIKILNKDFW